MSFDRNCIESRKSHCPHSTSTQLTPNTATISFLCCYCNAHGKQDYALATDPEHGPYLPNNEKVWGPVQS